eukprot:3886882-Rhodomonas_salina.4
MEMNTVQSTIRTDAPIDLTKEDADADAQEEERHTTKKEDDDEEERWMWASGARRQQRRRVQQLESDSEDEEPKGNQTAEERKTGIDGGPHQPVSFGIQVKEEEEPTPGNKRHKADEPSLGKKSEEREDDAQRSCKLPKLASSLPTNSKIMIHSAAGRLENAIDPKYASASGASSQVKQREWKGAGEEDNNTATMEMEVQDSASAYSSTNAIGTGISSGIKRPGAVLPRQKQQCKLTLDQMSAELLEALKRDHQRKRESMAEKEAGTTRREVRVTLKLREGERVRMQSPAEVEQSLLGQLLLSRCLARREAPLPIASDSASGADGKERYCRGRAMTGVEEALCREVNSFLELELLAPRFSCKQSSLIVADTVRAGDELIVLVRLADERGQNITNPLVIQQVAPRVSLWVGNEEQQECTWDTDVFGEFAKSGILCQPYIATRVKAPTWALPAGWKIAVRHRPTSIVKASQDQHTIGSQVVKIGPSTPVFVDSMFDILVNNALQGRGAMMHCGDSVDVQLRLKQRGVQAKDRFGNQATWPPDHSETRDVLQAFSLEINLKAQNTFHPAGEVTSELASETAEGARTWKLCIKRAGAFEVRLRHRGIGVSLSSAPIKCDFALDPSVWSAGDLTAFMCEQGAITKRDVLLMAYNREMAGQDLFTVPRTDFSPPPDSNASDSDITLELFAALTDRDDVVAVAGMSGKAVAKHHAKRVTTLLTERRRKAMQLASPEKMAEEQALREARKWIVGHGPPLEWLGLREAGTEGGRERVELDKNGNLFQHIAGMPLRCLRVRCLRCPALTCAFAGSAMLHGVMAKCEVRVIPCVLPIV